MDLRFLQKESSNIFTVRCCVAMVIVCKNKLVTTDYLFARIATWVFTGDLFAKAAVSHNANIDISL